MSTNYNTALSAEQLEPYRAWWSAHKGDTEQLGKPHWGNLLDHIDQQAAKIAALTGERDALASFTASFAADGYTSEEFVRLVIEAWTSATSELAAAREAQPGVQDG